MRPFTSLFSCVSLIAAPAAIPGVTFTDDVDQGKSCFKIQTSTATYYFQKESAGFSSIVDKNGNEIGRAHV